jgi:hypothetical protein
MFMKRALKFFVLGLIVLSLATIAFAYAATNNVPSGYYGDGSGAISGYTVSNIVYTPDANDPVNIATVAFSLNAAATTVQVRLTTGGALFACTNTAGNDWSCAIGTVTVQGATKLEVIASN